MDAYEEYERLASEFYRDTGLMAPGKDDPMPTVSIEERRERWREWLAARSEADGGEA